MLGRLQQRHELTAFMDVHFTPMLINDLVDVLVELIELRVEGILHVAGSERLSKCDFARRLADVYGLSTDLIRPISVEQHAFKARRPKDMSLSTQKGAQILGRPMPGVVEGLRRLRELEEQGWAGELAAATLLKPSQRRWTPSGTEAEVAQ